MDLLSDAAAFDQLLDLVSGRLFCHADESADNVVAACVYPVILRICVRIHFQFVAVAHDVPRTVYFQITETITVIPFFDHVISVHFIVVSEHFPDLCVCEAKVFVVQDVFYGNNFEIIKSCKNTFL